MYKPYFVLALSVSLLISLVTFSGGQSPNTKAKEEEKPQMQLGSFSVSLTVKDIKKSKQFYEKLGFQEVAGELDKNWIIMRNGTTTIGLFQGMFEKNIMTFNPGWDKDQNTLKSFQDVRELQAKLIASGINPDVKADENGTGPSSFVIQDPDGNPILFDQHVDKPK